MKLTFTSIPNKIPLFQFLSIITTKNLFDDIEIVATLIVNYNNKNYNTKKNDSIFNTWHTDSSEFILYKNSDSSILVNIFKRTYL